MQTHTFVLSARTPTDSQAHVGRKSRRAGRLVEAEGWYEGVRGGRLGSQQVPDSDDLEQQVFIL